MGDAFSKVSLLILNMFLLNRVLFQVKNLLWRLVERLLTESLVLIRNLRVIRYEFVLLRAAHVLPRFIE